MGEYGGCDVQCGYEYKGEGVNVRLEDVYGCICAGQCGGKQKAWVVGSVVRR